MATSAGHQEANTSTWRSILGQVAVPVAARVTFTATHSGPLFGFPATGKQAVLSVLYLYTFAEGRVRTAIGESNLLGLLVDLGLLSPPAPEVG